LTNSHPINLKDIEIPLFHTTTYRSARYLHNVFVGLIIHPFAAHPPTRAAVSWNMTKAAGEQAIDPLPKRMQSEAVRITRLGSFTYIPTPARDDAASGILANGGRSVTLDVTGSDLQNLVHTLNILESGLSRRWAELEV
jgi:hypothetical protein